MIEIYSDEKRSYKIDAEEITIQVLYELAKQEGKTDYQIRPYFYRDAEEVDSINFDDKTKTVYI